MYHNKYRIIIPFLLPALLIYGIFVLYPYAQAFYLSLLEWSGTAAERPFVGLDNFKRLFSDGRFMDALTNNAKFLVVLPVVTLTVAMTFAALFTQGASGVKFSGFYRVVFFFPQVMSMVIIGILFQRVYSPRNGLLNSVVREIGGPENFYKDWLASGTIFWSIAFVFVWWAVGFYMVIFMASMQSIPTSLYEAATLDGAGAFKQFKDITFPLIWETLRTCLIYISIAALDMYVLIYVIINGSTSSPGPRSVETVAVYMYIEAFQKSRWGMAAAIGVVLLMLTLLFSVVLMRLTKRETYEF